MSDTTLAVKTIKNSLLNIASFVTGLLVNFYLLRYTVAEIGVAAYGISGLLLSLVAPLNLTNLGFGEATTKYVAEFMHSGEPEKAASYIRTTFFMNLVVGVFGLLVLYFLGGKLMMLAFHESIPVEQEPTVTLCMKFIAFGWLFNQCSATFMGIPVALQKFRFVAGGNLIFVVSSAIYTYLLLMTYHNLEAFTLATVCGQFTVLLFWYFASKKLLPTIRIIPKIDQEAWKNSFHYGGWQTIAQIGGILAQQAEKFIMGAILTVSTVGIYNVALRIEQTIYMLVHKLSEVLFPMFSTISNDTTDRKANILIKSTWITTSLAVMLLVSVVPFAQPLIRMWMKNPQLANDGQFVLQVLCIAGAFGSATTAGYFFLLGIGKTKKITYIAILTGMTTVIAALVILPVYGLQGAGWGALVAAIVQSVAIIRVMYTAIKEVMPLSAILTAVFAPIVTGVLITLGVSNMVHLEISNWWMLGLGYGAMFALTGTAIVIVTRMLPYGKDHEELLRKLITHILFKIKARLA